MKSSILKLAASLVLLFAACGGDDDDTDSKSDPVLKPGELGCGSKACALPNGITGETLCCKDAFTGTCGIKAGDGCRDFPMPDERCPPPPVQLPSFPGAAQATTYGCCTDQGECGVDLGMTIPGQASSCVPRTFLCNFVSRANASMIEPKTCDGEPIELPADCGSTGRGGQGRGPAAMTGTAGMSGGASGAGGS
jgi:hypothetical protein